MCVRHDGVFHPAKYPACHRVTIKVAVKSRLITKNREKPECRLIPSSIFGLFWIGVGCLSGLVKLELQKGRLQFEDLRSQDISMDLPQPFHNFSGPIFQTSAFCGFRQARPLGQKNKPKHLRSSQVGRSTLWWKLPCWESKSKDV